MVGFCIRLLLFAIVPTWSWGQISFFNMPNPDMLAHPGAAYVEYDRYQTHKKNETVNASVVRFSFQATNFLEVGANTWFNADHPQDPNRVVLATKWKVVFYKKGDVTISMSPGNWSSLYFTENTATKHLLYNFIGFTHQEGPKAYTRLMLGGYGKFIGNIRNDTYGAIAGLEHRFNDRIEFVADYFQGSGEGFGLATGIVYYAMDEGHNLPLYFAYQFDNDSRLNDLILFQIGYFFSVVDKK
jgi:hypothetical protein